MQGKLKNAKGITRIAIIIIIVIVVIVGGVALSFVGIIENKKYKETSKLDESEINNIVEPKRISDWGYTVDEKDNTITIDRYKGKEKEVVIPNYIKGIPVKNVSGHISDNLKLKESIWDKKICKDEQNLHQGTIEKVIVSEGIQSIESMTFAYTKNLKEVVLPNSLKKIENYAFLNCCSLEKIVIPNSVTQVKEYAFSACDNLKSVTISNNMTSIEELTFYGCDSLENVTIPDSVISIGRDAFGKCNNLKDIIIPNSVKFIEKGAFAECKNLTNVVVPDSIVIMEESVFKDISPDAQITCDFESKPSDWSSRWTNCKNIIWKRAQTNQT